MMMILHYCVPIDKNVFGFKEGLLSSLTSLKAFTVPRNNFHAYPSGGPSQFVSVEVSPF